MTLFSPHFAHAEFFSSDERPPAEHMKAMGDLCNTILEPIWEHVQEPGIKRSVHINDGWRSSTNTTGVATSQHRLGQAADIRIDGIDPIKLWQWIAWESKLPFGQVILERYASARAWDWTPGVRGSWIHISLGEPWRALSKCRQVYYSKNAGPDVTYLLGKKGVLPV
jgi:zinc D-Ala-D-Ala carboxypeptidase